MWTAVAEALAEVLKLTGTLITVITARQQLELKRAQDNAHVADSLPAVSPK